MRNLNNRFVHGEVTNGSCECFHGTAHFDTATGVCTCSDNNGTIQAVPSMPTNSLPAGFHWSYNTALHKWIPTRDVVTPVINTMNNPIDNAKTWILNNKGLSLVIVAGVLYFVVKKK